MQALIKMKDVSFIAHNNLIVRNFSYNFEEGKTTVLVGPSGSGKSTVLKLCAGVLVPSSGTVFFRDKDIFIMPRNENLAFRRDGAMVFQDSALWANQTLYQNLELPLNVHFPKMSRRERENRIHSVLKDVGYRRDLSIRPSQLSIGEQKLIAFARAMICRPTLLFLDEWTESLDDSSAQRLISLVRRYQAENHTVILVSHDFRIIKNLADYIVMILEGQFFLQFTKQQITEDEELALYVRNGIES